MATPITTEIFRIIRDDSGYTGYGLLYTADSWSVILPIDTDTVLTIPSNYQFWFMIARIDIGNIVYSSRNSVAVPPTTNLFVNNQSCMISGLFTPKLVFAGDDIHFISTTGGQLEVSLYAIQNL